MAIVDSHGDPVAEHRAVLEGAGVIDRSDRPRLEVGGSERQTFLQRLPGSLVGADLVELNPACDPGGLTARVAAKLAKELLARLLSDPEH